MRKISFLFLFMMLVSAIAIVGCGSGSGSSSDAPGGGAGDVPTEGTGASSSLAGTQDEIKALGYEINASGVVSLAGLEIGEINGGFNEAVAPLTDYEFVNYLASGTSAMMPSGGGSLRNSNPFGASLRLVHVEPGENKTLTDNENTIKAKIVSAGLSSSYVESAFFTVPTGKKARNLKLVGLTSGQWRSGAALRGTFCIADGDYFTNRGTYFAYTAPGNNEDSTVYPVQLTQLELREGTYALLVGGGVGAECVISAEVSNANATSTTSDVGGAQIALIWETQNVDIDLHIEEASGKHVYYGNKEGIAGRLDMDNIKNEGSYNSEEPDDDYFGRPENYFFTVDSTRATGKYLVYLDHYRGASSAVCKVRIVLPGNVARTVNLTLSEGERKSVGTINYNDSTKAYSWDPNEFTPPASVRGSKVAKDSK